MSGQIRQKSANVLYSLKIEKGILYNKRFVHNVECHFLVKIFKLPNTFFTLLAFLAAHTFVGAYGSYDWDAGRYFEGL